MPDEVYHARPELSSSQARDLLKSPHIYKYKKGKTQKPTPAMIVGTATHTKVLGVGAQVITYPEEHLTPSRAVSTKAETRAWIEEQESAGRVLLTASDMRRVDAMAEAVLAEPEARKILERVEKREVSIFNQVQGVDVRARFDLYDGLLGADLKTAADASPAGFNRIVGQRGYHIQEAWYEDAHYAETGTPLEEFKFLVVENTAPYSVAVYDLDPMWREIAAGKVFNARETYKRCVETNTWPGYGAATLTAPTWAVYEGEEEEIKI